jgi:hypothetical protein
MICFDSKTILINIKQYDTYLHRDLQYSKEATEKINILLNTLLDNIISKLPKNKEINDDIMINTIIKYIPKYIGLGFKNQINQNTKLIFNITKKYNKTGQIILTLFLEYICREILDLAANYCRDSGKKRILSHHIEYVIKNDVELKEFLIFPIEESFYKIKSAIDKDIKAGFKGIDLNLDSKDYSVEPQTQKIRDKIVEKIRALYPNTIYEIEELDEYNKNFPRHHLYITF